MCYTNYSKAVLVGIWRNLLMLQSEVFMDISVSEQRLYTMIPLLRKHSIVCETELNEFLYMETGYKNGSVCPVLTSENAHSFKKENFWGGKADAHAWFYTTIKHPQPHKGIRCELKIKTDVSEKEWDASNPQFIVYFDGKPVQGADLNHTHVILPQKAEIQVHIYAYTGTNLQEPKPLKLIASILEIDELAERLYYDLKVPYDVLAFTDKNTKEYADIVRFLNNALNFLDWRSEARLRASFESAEEYIQKEFYEKYCKKGNVKVK